MDLDGKFSVTRRKLQFTQLLKCLLLCTLLAYFLCSFCCVVLGRGEPDLWQELVGAWFQLLRERAKRGLTIIVYMCMYNILGFFLCPVYANTQMPCVCEYTDGYFMILYIRLLLLGCVCVNTQSFQWSVPEHTSKTLPCLQWWLPHWHVFIGGFPTMNVGWPPHHVCSGGLPPCIQVRLLWTPRVRPISCGNFLLDLFVLDFPVLGYNHVRPIPALTEKVWLEIILPDRCGGCVHASSRYRLQRNMWRWRRLQK